MKDQTPLLVLTTDLAYLYPHEIQELKANGLGFIRPFLRPWAKTLRNPISGTMVELLPENRKCCVPIDSRAAQKLIRS